MVARTKVKRTVKKVTKALKKASNAHAKQARSLAALKLKAGGVAKKRKKNIQKRTWSIFYLLLRFGTK